MKIEIEIDNEEVRTIIESLKDQGIDVTVDEVKEQIEDWFHVTIEDFRDSRIEEITDILIDLADIE
jgi:hypothetical protein